jgi:hypothetical protein
VRKDAPSQRDCDDAKDIFQKASAHSSIAPAPNWLGPKPALATIQNLLKHPISSTRLSPAAPAIQLTRLYLKIECGLGFRKMTSCRELKSPKPNKGRDIKGASSRWEIRWVPLSPTLQEFQCAYLINNGLVNRSNHWSCSTFYNVRTCDWPLPSICTSKTRYSVIGRLLFFLLISDTKLSDFRLSRIHFQGRHIFKQAMHCFFQNQGWRLELCTMKLALSLRTGPPFIAQVLILVVTGTKNECTEAATRLTATHNRAHVALKPR